MDVTELWLEVEVETNGKDPMAQGIGSFGLGWVEEVVGGESLRLCIS